MAGSADNHDLAMQVCLTDAYQKPNDVIASGAAKTKLDQLVAVSNNFKHWKKGV